MNWPWSLECYNTLKTGVQTHILDNNQLQLFYCCFCHAAHTFSFCRIISSVWAHYDHVTTQCPGLQSMPANHLFPRYWLVNLRPFWALIGWLKAFFLRMSFVWQQSNQCHWKNLDDHFWTNLLNFEKLNAWNFKWAQSYMVCRCTHALQLALWSFRFSELNQSFFTNIWECASCTKDPRDKVNWIFIVIKGVSCTIYLWAIQNPILI